MKRSIRKTAIATLLAASTFAGAASAEQYVCEIEQAGGFAYSTIIQDQWTLTRFNDEVRFLIESNGDTATASMFGQSGVTYDCKPFTNIALNHNFFSCNPDPDVSIHLWFNIDLLRFTVTNLDGFTSGDDEPGSDFIGIGTCAELGG